jgi:hypothetical protein
MNKKIMVVGNYKWDIYEKALSEGFLQNGVEVSSYIVDSWSLSSKILNYKKLCDKNEKFINEVLAQQPDAIFLYRINDIFPKSLHQIKNRLPKIKIAIFHNDNPYIGFKNRVKYHLFLECIKIADLVYVYRPSNLHDVKQRGVKEPKLLYPHFYSKNDLVDHVDFSIKKYDVVFIGHYEKNRAESIDYLLKKGIDVKIFGPIASWEKIKNKYNWSNSVVNAPVFGDKYREALTQAKVALCFLSKINKDVYTRRNFEIPAAGTLTVGEYTVELTSLFREDEEILLFKNNLELYRKIDKVLTQHEFLKTKTIAAYNKIKFANHSEKDRAKQVLHDLGIYFDKY